MGPENLCPCCTILIPVNRDHPKTSSTRQHNRKNADQAGTDDGDGFAKAYSGLPKSLHGYGANRRNGCVRQIHSVWYCNGEVPRDEVNFSVVRVSCSGTSHSIARAEIVNVGADLQNNS
jgi:hypothetical protein